MYWYNVNPKDDTTPSTAPSNGFYRYEQHMKWIDVSLNIVDNQYQVGDDVLVSAPHSRCSSRFGKGQVDWIVPKQYWLT